MNTAYITLDSVSNPIVRSQVIEYLIYLSKEFNITLISFESKKDKNAFDRVQQILSEHRIAWYRIPYSNRFNFISIGWSLLVAPFRIYPLLKKSNVKIVHARSMLTAVMALILSLFLKFKFIYDIREFWADEKAERGRIKKDGLLHFVLNKLDYVVYKKCDAVVTVTHRSVDVIVKKYYIQKEKIFVITNTADKNTFPVMLEADKLALRKKLGFSQQDIIIVHPGSVMGHHNLPLEIKIFKALTEIDSSFKFLVVTKQHNQWVKTQFENLMLLDNQYRVVDSEFSEVYKYLNISNFSIFLVIPTPSKVSAFPVKFAESIATHLPIISNADVGDMQDYFTQFNVGLCLNYREIENDPGRGAKQIYHWISSYKKDENEFQKLMDQHLNKKIACQSYRKIYRALLGENEAVTEKEVELTNV